MKIKKLALDIEEKMNNLTIKKKFYVFYILCVLVPLIITDSVVFHIVRNAEQERQEHEMANIANAVGYSLIDVVEGAAQIAKSIYTNRDYDDFLSREYANSAEYVSAYQDFFKNTLMENALGMNNIVFTMYTDNATIVKGGKVDYIGNVRETVAYQELKETGRRQGLFFVYDNSGARLTDERRVLYLQKLNFFSKNHEKLLKIEFDYGNLMRTLKNMNYDNEVLICVDNKIVLSNGNHGSHGSDFETIEVAPKGAYAQTISLYGTDMDIYVLKAKGDIWNSLWNNSPIIVFLFLVNVLLPLCLVHIFNHSFTKRITELSEVFKSVEGEQLIPMEQENGKDEIGSMIRNYNRMVERTNGLIQTVYKNKLKEQEMLVGRKNAELLALHSQINPHFLFNALESIRMHSILKRENETADMVEKLATMQRQYVEWGSDSVTIEQEIEFVKAYLALQKYRFGDRLNYKLDIMSECERYRIPKLTIVTFVENACIHGIESKSTPGWIFVRISRKEQMLCIEIEDTGNGMEEEKMEDLRNHMQNASIDMLKGSGSVGITNACLRLKMVTENQVEFELDGEEGIGTVVLIKVPMEYV